MNEISKLTDIDLSNLQIGEKLILYRGSNAFLSGPCAAGYVGEATVLEVQGRSAILQMPSENRLRGGNSIINEYRLRFSDSRICRIPNGEPTMLYVHARSGRPTVTAYFTDDEYTLVQTLLYEEAATPHSLRTGRHAKTALERMAYHDNLRSA
jgi:hypothetical protein